MAYVHPCGAPGDRDSAIVMGGERAGSPDGAILAAVPTDAIGGLGIAITVPTDAIGGLRIVTN